MRLRSGLSTNKQPGAMSAHTEGSRETAAESASHIQDPSDAPVMAEPEPGVQGVNPQEDETDKDRSNESKSSGLDPGEDKPKSRGTIERERWARYFGRLERINVCGR